MRYFVELGSWTWAGEADSPEDAAAALGREMSADGVAKVYELADPVAVRVDLDVTTERIPRRPKT